MVDLSPNVINNSINIKGAQTQMKRQIGRMDKKKNHDTTICCIQEIHLRYKSVSIFK